MSSNTTFQCSECGLHYRDEETSKKCESFCRKYHACSLDITKLAIENVESTT